MLGLIGKKLGMTQVYTKDGVKVPVTVLQVGPCTVVQRKSKNSDGYNALQLGFEDIKPQKMQKARRLHCEKKGLKTFRHLKEFRIENAEKFEVGQVLTVKGFKPGDIIDVIGTTKGRGYQGVIKRHGKHGGPMSHGSDFHRRPGGVGMCTWPGRLFKNTRLPGQYGNESLTIKNLSVVDIRPEDNVLLIKGGIPGPRKGLVFITNKNVEFETREELVEKPKSTKEEVKEQEKPEVAQEAKAEETTAENTNDNKEEPATEDK